MIPEDFWTDDEPATFPTRDAELAAAVDRLEARTVPHADRDHSEGPHVHEWERRQNVTTKGYALPAYEACECGAARSAEPYWPTGAAQRARGRDDSATGHTETGEAQRGAQEPVEHNHPLDCPGCRKRGAEVVALRAEVERLRRENRIAWNAAVAREERTEAAEAERDEVAGRLSALLCDLTGGRLSKPTYDVPTMVAEIDSAYDDAHQEDRAERDRLAGVVERVRGVAEALVTAAQIEAHGGEEHTASLLLAVRTDLLMHLDADAPEASEEGRRLNCPVCGSGETGDCVCEEGHRG